MKLKQKTVDQSRVREGSPTEKKIDSVLVILYNWLEAL